ncbi:MULTISPECIES: sugar phosphate isomerase/epimerase [Paenibacillus]|uniref:sugar phosphate isomerase/epimerase family protein n=1 Tax=Paenibacillus TaxID=44249 RepID=UPI000E2867F7|nr:MULTISPECIES: sugar phosphate isomerase/epimerase [Paenibacillus]MCM2997066.1 sugar phosphate isomerase/epimerase [Paenibacillus cellulositrophicus]RED41737.1 sugar phosphate isomerase/epimerase [Paenibacillus sp. VMFN-D1]
MIQIPVGLQLFSVREALAKDFAGTLQSIADIGYKNIEFAFHNIREDGTFEVDYTAAELKAMMDKLGLQVVTSHVAYHPNLDLDAVIRYNAEIGSKGIVMPCAFFRDREDAVELAKWLNASGRKSKEAGIQFYFHNHFHEFQQFDGQTVMDILLEHTDPELVQIEFDTFWALRGGVDPIAFMDKYGSRIGLLHQKDLAPSANPVNLLEKVSGHLTDEVVFSAANQEDFTEIGAGVMDIPSILKKAEELGTVQYIIVEQDQTVKGELASVKESFDNIQRLLAQ